MNKGLSKGMTEMKHRMEIIENKPETSEGNIKRKILQHCNVGFCTG